MAVSLFAFSACGGGSSTVVTADQDENITNFLVDSACMIAKYNGDVPDTEMQDLNKKYGFADNAEADVALSTSFGKLSADEAKNMIARVAPMISAKCNDDFAKSPYTPEAFLQVAILPAVINK